MQLSKKSRYGLRALIYLAGSSRSRYVSLGSIARAGEIPPQFLEQVFASLRRAGLVKGLKGPQGGYKLNLEPKDITVDSVLNVLEGSYLIGDEEASADSRCYAMSMAIQERLIDPVNENLEKMLGKLTLADLLEAYEENLAQGQGMYYI